MGLHLTPVSQCLERKLTIAGFEIPDLLFVGGVLSTLNFLFGWTGHRILFVWLPTLSVSLLLRFGKQGKPDRYLIHWIRARQGPRYFSAFQESKTYRARAEAKLTSEGKTAQ